ncbi:MAG: Eco57I restriction-modification methylase domain-containing protein [Candidatus Hodarchaeales archaeon]
MGTIKMFTKDYGEIYTPKELAEYIAAKTIFFYLETKYNVKISTIDDLKSLERDRLNIIHKKILNLKILDPCAGDGEFLVEAFRFIWSILNVLKKRGIENREDDVIARSIIENNLYGVDISKEALTQCRTRLSALAGLDGDSNKFYLFKGDALIGAISRVESYNFEGLKAFNWNVIFPNIIKNRGFDIILSNPPWNILKPSEKEFFANFDSRLTKYNVDKIKARKIIDDLLQDDGISSKWSDYKNLIKIRSKYFRSNYKYQSGHLKIRGKTRRVSGDLNLYKLFIERIYFLLKPGGCCGLVVPSGIYTDAGTSGLRQLLFENCQVKDLFAFENRKGIFPTIHRSFKFCVLVFKKNGYTSKFSSSFMLRKLLDIHKNNFNLDWNEIKHFSPSSWSIIEFKTKQDLDLTRKLFEKPTLAESFPNFVMTRELDLTLDSHLFNTEGNGIPIYEGKMIEQFNPSFARGRYWITQDKLKIKNNVSFKNIKSYRLAFRSIAASTNRRTMIATIVPKNVCCANSLIVSKVFDKTGTSLISETELLYLCGIFNSFVFDFLLRLKVTTNINMFFVYDMPVPQFGQTKTHLQIISDVANILSRSEKLMGLRKYCINPDNEEKEQNFYLLARINYNIAKLFSLKKNDIEYILKSFPYKQLDLIKECILKQFNV